MPIWWAASGKVWNGWRTITRWWRSSPCHHALTAWRRKKALSPLHSHCATTLDEDDKLRATFYFTFKNREVMPFFMSEVKDKEKSKSVIILKPWHLIIIIYFLIGDRLAVCLSVAVCLCMYCILDGLSVSICLSVSVCLCMYVSMPVCLYQYVCVCILVCLSVSVCMAVYQYVCLYHCVCVSVCLSVWIVCLSVCISMSLW